MRTGAIFSVGFCCFRKNTLTLWHLDNAAPVSGELTLTDRIVRVRRLRTVGFTRDETERVLAVLQNKTRKPIRCAVCTSALWTLVDGFIFLPIQETASLMGVSPTSVNIIGGTTTMP